MRDDFSEKVKWHVARRVGLKCSKPDCRVPTSGPTVDDSQSLNIGVAAHICAASPLGARYDPDMTSEERSHAKNAIWLCQNHGKMVDKDEYRFTCELLQEWKADAEDEALSEIGKTAEEYELTRLDGPDKLPPGKHLHEEFELEEGQGIFYDVSSDYPINVMVFAWEDYKSWIHGKENYKVYDEQLKERLVRNSLRLDEGSFVFVIENDGDCKTKFDVKLTIIEDHDP